LTDVGNVAGTRPHASGAPASAASIASARTSARVADDANGGSAGANTEWPSAQSALTTLGPKPPLVGLALNPCTSMIGFCAA
jgi:hypothetical protein